MSLLKGSEIKVCMQSEFMNYIEIVVQELKDAYYTELSASKATTSTTSPFKESKLAGGKSRPLLKKKAAEDPFASDEETDPKGKKLADVGKKRKAPESEGSGSGSKSPVKRKNV